jgi:hypothetical protein
MTIEPVLRSRQDEPTSPASPAAKQAGCCAPQEQSACCEPAQKTACCSAAATAGGSCGCR